MRRRTAEGKILRMVAELRREISQGDLTLGEIFDILKTSGHDLLILFICLPFLQPIPLVGLSTPLGILIVLSTLQKMRGRPPWIPKSWRRHDLSGPLMGKTLEYAEWALQKVSRLLHPRLQFLTLSPGPRILSGVVVVLSALFMALPLPVPFSNLFPVLVIVASTLGQLEEDGVWILMSYFLFLVCFGFFGGMALGVIKGIGLLGGSFGVSP